MIEEDRFLLEDMFFKLTDENITEFDRATIIEQFNYITLDHLNPITSKKKVGELIDLYEHFERIAFKQKNEFLTGFFLGLGEILTLKHKITKLSNEQIDREAHNKSVEELRKRNNWYYAHVLTKNSNRG